MKKKAKAEVIECTCGRVAIIPNKELGRSCECGGFLPTGPTSDKNWRLCVLVYSDGVPKCACCGSTERLCLDHVFGDGSTHRKSLTGSSNASSTLVAKHLIELNFPSDIQVLCVHCNSSKSNGETCNLHSKSWPKMSD